MHTLDVDTIRTKGGENMKVLHMVTFTLLVVGGVNWGLVGLFNYNLVMSLFGPVEKLIYVLVGVSAVYIAATHMGDCKMCGK